MAQVAAQPGVRRATAPADERAERLARACLTLIGLAAGALGLSLWVGAAGTATFFAWTILSPTAAGALGGFYIGIALTAGAGLLEPEWTRARAILPGAITGPLLLLIPTVVHHALFHFDHVITWLWIGLYLAFPPVLLWLYVNALRWNGAIGAEEVTHAWQRGGMAVLAVALAVLGLALLIVPDHLATVWAWPMTPLIGRVYGCWFVASALGAFAVARERSWEYMRAPVRAMVAMPAAVAVGPLIHPDQFTLNAVGGIWVFGMLAVSLYSAALLWVHRAHLARS